MERKRENADDALNIVNHFLEKKKCSRTSKPQHLLNGLLLFLVHTLFIIYNNLGYSILRSLPVLVFHITCSLKIHTRKETDNEMYFISFHLFLPFYQLQINTERFIINNASILYSLHIIL